MEFYTPVSNLSIISITLTDNATVFEAFPVIFIETRGFTITQQGLLFIGIGIGSVLTTFMNLYFAKQVNKIIPKWKGFPPAELRLYSAMIGSVMLVIGSFWLGWTGNYASVPWYVPGISTVFVGMAISAIFTSLIVSPSSLNLWPSAHYIDTDLHCRHVFVSTICNSCCYEVTH